MRREGSMTCFAAMTIMLVAAFLFALLEAGRSIEMHKLAEMNSHAVTESVFAGYVSPLWEDYHLLGVPLCDRTGVNPRVTSEMYQFSKNNLQGESVYLTNLLAMTPMEFRLEEWELITDGESDSFVRLSSSYMKENLAFEAVDTLVAYTQGTKEIMESEYADSSAVERALEALEGLGEEGDSPVECSASPANGTSTGGSGDDSLFQMCQNTKSRGVLELVIQDTSKVSEKEVELEQVVSKREITSGNMAQAKDMELSDSLLFEAYLNKYLASYLSTGQGSYDRALSYEKEYLVAGKSSDIDNLKAVVNRILLVREASNLMYIATNPQKNGEAESLAILIAGATANPLIIQAVKWGILASWAYFESILDVRTLLQGKRIPFIKDETTWTSDLSGLSEIADGYLTAKEVEAGISYQDYLGVFMLLDGQKKAAFRAMDVMELTVQKQKGWSNFQMDEVMVSGKFCYEYQYPSIFLGMDNITRGKKDTYHVVKRNEYSYMGKEI